MSIFYSPSVGGFFTTELHGDTMPIDAVAISAARHRELIAGQSSGATIVAGDDGRPRLHRTRTTLAERRATAIRRAKREAARRIERVSPIWRQCNDIRCPTGAAQARFAAIDAIRTASAAIETEVAAADAAALEALDIPAHPLWPEA